LKKIDEIHAAAARTTDEDELDDLRGDAELQGLFVAPGNSATLIVDLEIPASWDFLMSAAVIL
jgi:hypothetical protein